MDDHCICSHAAGVAFTQNVCVQIVQHILEGSRHKHKVSGLPGQTTLILRYSMKCAPLAPFVKNKTLRAATMVHHAQRAGVYDFPVYQWNDKTLHTCERAHINFKLMGDSRFAAASTKVTSVNSQQCNNQHNMQREASTQFIRRHDLLTLPSVYFCHRL